MSLVVAAQRLADLIEPSGGFAVQGGQSRRAQELCEATRRELRRRDARLLGLPDSLVKN